MISISPKVDFFQKIGWEVDCWFTFYIGYESVATLLSSQGYPAKCCSDSILHQILAFHASKAADARLHWILWNISIEQFTFG